MTQKALTQGVRSSSFNVNDFPVDHRGVYPAYGIASAHATQCRDHLNVSHGPHPFLPLQPRFSEIPGIIPKDAVMKMFF
jgi:hypothetical protein